MFKRLFIDHPKSVDENYVEHFAVAGKFGVTMIWGGLCALVHAVVPGWCCIPVTIGHPLPVGLVVPGIRCREAPLFKRRKFRAGLGDVQLRE